MSQIPACEERCEWIAAGMGIPPEELEWMLLREAGLAVFRFSTGGLELAIGEDGMRAFASIVDPKLAEDAEGFIHLLGNYHIQVDRVPALRSIRQRRSAESLCWIDVARGEFPLCAGEEQFLLLPDAEGMRPEVGDLHLRGEQLLKALAAKSLDEEALKGVLLPLVESGGIVAEIATVDRERSGRDVFGRPVDPAASRRGLDIGRGLEREGDKVRATACGYLVVRDGVLELCSPLWVAPEGMKAYWLLLDGRSRSLPAERVRKCLGKEGVVVGIDSNRIDEAVERMLLGVSAGSAVVVAKGEQPILDRLELIAGSDDIPGQKARVRQGEVVAWHLWGVRERPGVDVRGKEISPTQEAGEAKRPGCGLRRARAGERELFLATCDGVVGIFQGVLNVHPLLTLDHDVERRHGSLHYEGTMHVRGSLRGCSVLQASGDMVVEGVIEKGGCIEVGQSLYVRGCIAGRNTKLRVGGGVPAASIAQAAIEAGGDIAIETSLENAAVWAGGRLIAKGNGRLVFRGGGRVYAMGGIRLSRVESVSDSKIVLAASLTPADGERLERLNQRLGNAYREVQFIQKKLGLERLDIRQITKRLQATRGLQKKMLARVVRQLVEKIGHFQELRDARDAVRAAIVCTEGAEIRIDEGVPAGTEVRLGPYWRQFDAPVSSLHWRLHQGALVELDTERNHEESV